MDSLNELLQQAETLIAEGDKASAKKAIRAALKADIKNGQAWYLASMVADSPEQKRDALQRALDADPEHWLARAGLAALYPEQPKPDKPPAAEPPSRRERRAASRRKSTADEVFRLEGEVSSLSPNEPFTTNPLDSGITFQPGTSGGQKRRTLVIVQPAPDTAPMRVVYVLIALAVVVLLIVMLLAIAYRDNLSALTNIFSPGPTSTVVSQ